jgi:NADH-quinone oxidoreductase subunit H
MGALRSVVQVLSYEIPIGLTVLTVVFFSGSIDLVEIVNHQQHGRVWFGFMLPVSFVVFWISGIAETNRAPFDLPEAEAELVAGYHTEYSGLKFAYFYIAEYTHMVLISSLVVMFFLYVYVWIRATLPRYRFDALIKLAWKWLVPLSLANLFVVVTLKVLL